MKKGMDMLHGSIWNKMVLFALPLAASSILQQLFNAADVAVVGRFAGQNALAAVGANAPVINLLVNFFTGLSVGANAVLSRYIGQDNPRKIQDAVHTSIAVAFISGCTLLGLGNLLAGPVIGLLQVPADIAPLAEIYFRVYFLGMPFIMLYNFSSAVLRSQGDTKRPLIALSMAGVINVLLNLYFVLVMQLSVVGVALATAISNVVSSFTCLVFLHRQQGPFHFEISRLRISWAILKSIGQIGIPAGIQGVVFSLSNVIIQFAINRQGSLIVAGNTAALNYEYIAFFVCNAFNHTALTFIAQNYAAGKLERCRRCARWAFIEASLAILSVCGFFILSRTWTIQLFTSSSQVADIACTRMLILLSFEFFNCTIEVLSGILRGYGKSFIPAAVAILGVCGIRILIVLFLPDSPYAYEILMAAYPISWIFTSSVLFICYRLQLPKIFARQLEPALFQAAI